jgi:hypothetical protein
MRGAKEVRRNAARAWPFSKEQTGLNHPFSDEFVRTRTAERGLIRHETFPHFSFELHRDDAGRDERVRDRP